MWSYILFLVVACFCSKNSTFATGLQELSSFTNSPSPSSTLLLNPDGSFYGTTEGGGAFGLGTIFKLQTNGTLVTVASFDGTNGALPIGGMAPGNDGAIYGTAYRGGLTG